MQANFNGDFIKCNDKKVKSETRNLAWYLLSRSILYIIILFFALFFIWYTAFITTHKFYAVSGVSMMPTLNSQIPLDEMDLESSKDKSYDAVYVNLVAKPKIYDVIVIKLPNKKDSIIKRLMAVEGDFITIAKTTNGEGQDCLRFYRIPKGQNLSDAQAEVVEDGTSGSYSILEPDSLWTHKSQELIRPLVSELKIEKNGKSYSHQYEYNFYETFLKNYTQESSEFYVSDNGLLYVKVPQGKFFYMGDNRAHSSDARETDKGFGNNNYIVGKVESFVFNYNFANRLWEVVKYYFKEIDKFFAR